MRKTDEERQRERRNAKQNVNAPVWPSSWQERYWSQLPCQQGLGCSISCICPQKTWKVMSDFQEKQNLGRKHFYDVKGKEMDLCQSSPSPQRSWADYSRSYISGKYSWHFKVEHSTSLKEKLLMKAMTGFRHFQAGDQQFLPRLLRRGLTLLHWAHLCVISCIKTFCII